MCGTVYRDSLRSDLRNTSKHATALEQTSKEDRRRKLEGRLNQFHQKAGEYMGNNAEEDLDVLPKFTGQEDEDENQEDVSDVCEEDVSDVCEEDEEDKEEGNSSEATIILMPSSMKREDIQRLGLETLAAQELELRKGQAGDCLQSLRMALGHKAVLFRTRIRAAKTSTEKTRIWNDINVITNKVNKHVRAYRRAHKALHRLGADSATLMQYQELQSKHLSLSADITEENRVGQRSDVLPWFWRLYGQNTDQHNTWMNECKCSSLYTCSY